MMILPKDHGRVPIILHAFVTTIEQGMSKVKTGKRPACVAIPKFALTCGRRRANFGIRSYTRKYMILVCF